VAVAGIGISLAADAPTYGLVLLCVVVSGLGVAAYHPEGSKFAAFASGAKRASGMSYFSIGGNVGYALGPALATPLIVWQGLRGGLLLAVPCLIIAAVLWREAPYLKTFATEERHPRRAGGRDRPGALGILLGVICFRSVAWFGLVTFVPLWEVSLGHSNAYGNHLLTLMLLAGGLGTVVAGPLADRIGLRPVLLGSLAATAPLIVVFIAVGGVPGAIALALVGCCVIGTFGITMVMSQSYLPSRIGMASGLSIGLSIGLGGMAAVALGAVADHVDLRAALYICAVAPVAAFALAALLPRPARRVEPELVAAS
jgi:MFS transporter, FSR family, fosmidomycin resistance protein